VVEQQRAGPRLDGKAQAAPKPALRECRGVHVRIGTLKCGRHVSEAMRIASETARTTAAAETHGEISKDAGFADAQRSQQDQRAPMQDALLDFIEELLPAKQAVHGRIPAQPRRATRTDRPASIRMGTAASCAVTENATNHPTDTSKSTPIKALPRNQHTP